MPPAVIDAMVSFRSAINAQQQAESVRMARAWLEVSRGLDAEFEKLAREAAAATSGGRSLSLWHVQRMDRYQSLLGQILIQQRRFAPVAADEIAQTQALLGRWAITHSGQLITLQRPAIAGLFDRIPEKVVTNMVGSAGDGTPLGNLLRRSWGDEGINVGNVLVRGTALGWHPTKTARAMRDEVNVTLERAILIARSEELRVYREASRQQYIESNIVEGYRRLAAKSIRTCMACLMADGQFYPLSVPFEEHPAGRCSPIPAVIGAPPVIYETGEQWFMRQDVATQRKMMGPGRYEAWQEGRFALPDLVTVRQDATWGNSLQVTPLRALVVRPAGSVQRPPTSTATPAPVPALQPPPLLPTWRPSMSRSEAELWARDSKIKEDVTHTTLGDISALSIMQHGFDLSKRKFGRVWGNGVYAAMDNETTELYRSWAGPSARTIKLKINVSNVFTYEPTYQGFNNTDIIEAALGVSKAEATRIWGRANTTLDQILADAGYDAFHLKAHVSGFGGGPGGNQIVVFDPRKVVVIDDK